MNQRLGAGGNTLGKLGATIVTDREASKSGITRQSVIKVWPTERLEATAIGLPHHTLMPLGQTFHTLIAMASCPEASKPAKHTQPLPN